MSAPDHDWYADAACRGMPGEIFFPQRGEMTTTAKAVCASCTVREECLEAALGPPSEKFGVWGGMSERERRRVRHARNARRRLAS